MNKGDQVICIRDNWDLTHPTNKGICFPVKGQVYTIRDTIILNGVEGLVFEEIKNAARAYAEGIREIYFKSNQFKKVEDTNISIFHEILANPTKPIQETSYQ